MSLSCTTCLGWMQGRRKGQGLPVGRGCRRDDDHGVDDNGMMHACLLHNPYVLLHLHHDAPGIAAGAGVGAGVGAMARDLIAAPTTAPAPSLPRIARPGSKLTHADLM